MLITEFFIIFPEGDVQEIRGRLPINAIVDINGNQLSLPLPTNKMIAFRIAKISVNETRGTCETYHHLELLSAQDLLEFAK